MIPVNAFFQLQRFSICGTFVEMVMMHVVGIFNHFMLFCFYTPY
jgi:hypothetical protein